MVDIGRTTPWSVQLAAAAIRRLPVGRYRAAYWLSRSVNRPFWAELPQAAGSLRFRCNLRDGLMREAWLFGGYEPQETLLLRDALRPGMTFVDVGANWGYFTLLGAHLVGAGGRVVSIEADPRAVRAVRTNVDRNGLRQVELFGVAISDVPGELRFDRYEATGDDDGNYGVAQTAVVGVGSVVVPAQPLEHVLDAARIEHVDMLKMDIEGSEAAALAGAARALSAGRIDRILLELHPPALKRLGSSAAAVCALLRDAGYAGWTIDHSLETHRRAAAGALDAASLLTPLGDTNDLGAWPHVLWLRRNLPH